MSGDEKVISQEQVQYALDILRLKHVRGLTVDCDPAGSAAKVLTDVCKMADCEIKEGQKRNDISDREGLRYYSACIAYINDIPNWK